VEVAEICIFHTQAKYVEQEKPSLNAAVGFKPAHDEIAAAQIEKVSGTEGFGKTLHPDPLNTRCGSGVARKSYRL
jgi:hypothetical protein